MIELDSDNAVEYLRSRGTVAPGTRAAVRELKGGVSNIVLRVEPADGPPFVLKQSREKLRTKAEWSSRLDRIWREAEMMRTLAPLLPGGIVPRILFEDRENYLFAMQAADDGHVVWKAELLAGRADARIAAKLGTLLAAMHRQTCDDPTVRNTLGDREVFEQLRVDPFYRRIADVHPDLSASIRALIDEMSSTAVCLVHADFSPKNILVVRGDAGSAAKLTLVDYETGHYGDPAFDLGFFLSHLMLKTVLHAERRREFLKLPGDFLHSYEAELRQQPLPLPLSPDELHRRAVGHLGGCMLSRIDGKSTVDYLPAEQDRNLVRAYCRQLLLAPPGRLNGAFRLLGEMLPSADA